MVETTEWESDRQLDLRGVPCPHNYVRVKLALEEMASNAVLDLILDEGRPIENIPRTVQKDGHTVERLEPFAGEYFRLLIRKK